MYVCSKCGKVFSDAELTFVRCPYCSGKVLNKQTPPTVKKVRAA
ncbi:MAG: DNA-directed RNA polymerase subunit P [Candidatus Micrarchaeota archaeon]|nr:DNA-directed RNA polymerase subunit P [Candidatus Micrarchaeota archaeon]